MRRKKFIIPRLGIVGQARLREAEASPDFIALHDLLAGALKKLFAKDGDDEDIWPYVWALFTDAVIVDRDGKKLRYPYTVDGTEVTFGEPSEVVAAFVDPSENGEAGAEATFTEAHKEGKGARAFGVRIVRAGTSLNRNYYPDAVLREAAPLFEGVRVFVKEDEEHLAGRGVNFGNLIGKITGVHFKEGKSGLDTGELLGTFELMEPEGSVAVKLREAWDNRMTDLFGFSIDAAGAAETATIGGRPVRKATRIDSVDSVDLIVRPGADGGIIDFKEAEQTGDDAMWREKLIAAIRAVAPELLEGVDTATLTDEELDALFGKAFAKKTEGTTEDFTEAIRMVEARAYMREALSRCKLPEPAKARLREDFGNRASFMEAEVDRAILREGEYLSNFGGGAVEGMGAARVTRSAGEGTADMLDAFFNPRHKDHRNVRSFKECYIRMTGDTKVTGRMRDCDQVKMREALDSQSFEYVLGDAIHRALLADYNSKSQLDVWKFLATVTPAPDFRLQHRTRYGGYGDLPIVAEKGNYNPLTSPTDEEATYKVTKRGGTENLTLEMTKNDDVGSIQRIPVKLSRAAKRTLSKFVLDFIRTNPTIYDGKALFEATSHKNLGTEALSETSYAEGRLAMMQQAEPGSNERLSIPPRNLWIPAELENTAYNMFRRDTNLDETFVQSQHPTVIPVWYWTDPEDWVLSADVADIACVEIGFLDGDEEPDLFVQDNPTVGSLFTNDTITYKIRHIYGGNVLDYRGLYKSVVA